MKRRTALIVLAVVSMVVAWAALNRSVVQSQPENPEALNPWPPTKPVRLIFIHHSAGASWLADDNGGLGPVLRDNNYFVSDTNYGWGPSDPSAGGVIGDHNYIPDWYSWFTGPRRDIYLSALYAETEKHSSYSRMDTNPGGPN